MRLAPLPSTRRLAPFAVVIALTGVSGCSTILHPSQWVYKIDIQQGAVVTKEMVAQLKVGMSRDQVRLAIGTPAIADPFHLDRWDYPYRFQPGRGPIESRHFTVFFESDRLARWEGDPVPSEHDFVQSRIRLLHGENATAPSANPVPASTPMSAPGTDPSTRGPGDVPPPHATVQAVPPAATTDAPPATKAPDSPSLWDRVKGWFGGDGSGSKP